MKRVNHWTVELTDREMHSKDTFEGLLIEGLGIPEAARRALVQHGVTKPRDTEFIAYLSDDTVERHGSTVRIKKAWRTTSTDSAPSAEEMRQRLGLA